MDKRYKIDLPKGGAVEVETPPDFFRLPFVMLSIAKRMSGKTCSMSNFLHILNRMGRLDRVILVSPTFKNNQHYYAGLPLTDVIEPTLESAQLVMDKLEEEGKLYDEYFDKMKRWTELMKLVKYSKTNIDDIDETLFYDLDEMLEKPTYKYMRDGKPYKPIRCENLKLGWRIESWVLFYRGFTNLGFFCSNGGKIREKVNSVAICKCDNI